MVPEVYACFMSLNVKNPGTLSLIAALAQRLGTTKTRAIDEAVALRLQSLGQPARPAVETLLQAIWDGQTPAERRAVRSRLNGLYDENGLPQ